MPSYKVAHLHQQGQDMIIVPPDRNFGSSSENDQQAFMRELQMRCMGARARWIKDGAGSRD